MPRPSGFRGPYGTQGMEPGQLHVRQMSYLLYYPLGPSLEFFAYIVHHFVRCVWVGGGETVIELLVVQLVSSYYKSRPNIPGAEAPRDPNPTQGPEFCII